MVNESARSPKDYNVVYALYASSTALKDMSKSLRGKNPDATKTIVKHYLQAFRVCEDSFHNAQP